MIEQAFEVATEFRFDVGQALLNTNTLQGAVDDLSKSATGALTSLNYLATGLVAHLGFGAGGLLNVLSKAVSISEEFNAQALNFANNIGSNMNVLSGTIDTFNARLETSQMLMGNIQKMAITSGLPTGELAAITQKIASPLAQHGKLGTNYEGGIGMAKNLMLSSQAVGMNPAVAAETLSRALTDRMALHGALFARLANTQAFKSMHVQTQGQLQNMNTPRKIDLLAKALAQLGGDSEYARYRLDQIGTQITILRDQLEVALKPIGDALVKPIKYMLKMANAYLATHGKEIGDNIGKFIGGIFDDPKKLFLNLMQLKSFKGDLKKAMDITGLLLFIPFITSFTGRLKGLGKAVEGFMGVGTGAGFLTILQGPGSIIGKLFRLIGAAFSDFIPNVAAFLFFFQILSRARAKALLMDMGAWLELIPKFLAKFVDMKDALGSILLPLNMAIDFWSDLLAYLFTTSILGNIALMALSGLTDVLQFLGVVVIATMSHISGVMSVIIGFFYDLANLQSPFKNILQNYKEGFQDFANKHPMAGGNGSTPATKSVVYNNNHIEARFDMREQLEPDRIAFAVTTHLKKLAINATQARGGSISAAFAGNQLVGANP